jgi:hypothetical protein
VIGILTAFLRERANCTSFEASHFAARLPAFRETPNLFQLVATAETQSQKTNTTMAARLRKTFHYPTEDAPSSDSDREELDQQEQETIIEDLAKRDLDNTIFYRRAFVALPAAAALIYLPVLFSAQAFRHVLLALLSLTSLGGTGYILLYVHSAPVAVDSSSLSASMIDSRGPLDIALPWLNAALTAVLALSGILAWKRDLFDEAWRGFLPAGGFRSSTALPYTLLTLSSQPFSLSQCTLVLNSFLSMSLAWNVSSTITRVLDFFFESCMNLIICRQSSCNFPVIALLFFCPL